MEIRNNNNFIPHQATQAQNVTQGEGRNSSEACTICLDHIDLTQIKTLHCGHEFHRRCINEWCCHMNNTPTCPLCRAELIDSELPSSEQPNLAIEGSTNSISLQNTTIEVTVLGAGLTIAGAILGNIPLLVAGGLGILGSFDIFSDESNATEEPSTRETLPSSPSSPSSPSDTRPDESMSMSMNMEELNRAVYGPNHTHSNIQPPNETESEESI